MTCNCGYVVQCAEHYEQSLAALANEPEPYGHNPIMSGWSDA